MNALSQTAFDFDAETEAEGEPLIVALDGYEGPLHVLLTLAKAQKVDLLKLSVTLLAEQYLAFVRAAVGQRFTLAAEYLVMAAWLAFLKSRLLLPRAERATAPESPPEEVAARLAFRLAKLDAMRKAADAFAAQPQLGRDLFDRGDRDEARIVSTRRIEGDLGDLMGAYVELHVRARDKAYQPVPVVAFRLDDARERLRSLLPALSAWTPLERAAPEDARHSFGIASTLASTLSAALEMTREGEMELRQGGHFAPLYLRAAPSDMSAP